MSGEYFGDYTDNELFWARIAHRFAMRNFGNEAAVDFAVDDRAITDSYYTGLELAQAYFREEKLRPKRGSH